MTENLRQLLRAANPQASALINANLCWEAADSIDELLNALKVGATGLELAGYPDTARAARKIIAKYEPKQELSPEDPELRDAFPPRANQ